MQGRKNKCVRPKRMHADVVGFDGAVRFVHREAGILGRALALPGDRCRARTAIRAQARAHESWLALMRTAAAAERSDISDAISKLYAFHGRAAGHVERGGAPMLDPHVRRAVAMLLVAQLHDRTDDAVARLLARDRQAAEAPGVVVVH